MRGDRFNVWEDARFLADMLIVRNESRDRYWEDRARDLLTAIVAHACYDVAPEARSMNRLHAVANRVGWEEFVISLTNRTELAAMHEEGVSLQEINEKTLDGVLQTLKVTLQPWAGERVREVTKKSDWNPLDLRSPARPTVYLSLRPGEIDAFASVLRVFVGMHIRALTAELPPRGGQPILFMLDEMPRLKHMPPIEEALETGRQYGLWLWMFAQSRGQLEQAYRNADGMIGSCAVRAYMNPSSADGTAEKLSEQLGNREGALDSQRRRIVEAADLTGPDYRDDVIVFGTGSKPACVAKVFAHQTPGFQERLGLARQPSTLRL